MKFLKHTLILLTVVCFALSSCSKEDEAPSTKDIIQQGKWKIVLYKDNGAVKTNQYSGYDFKFNANGQLVASHSGDTETGSWSTGADESKNRLLLNFPLTLLSPLSDLNHDWSFVTKSYTVVELEFVSEDSGTDALILEKI